jgi:tRNA G18 (ribose-2'-O)-methylase SpoU
MKIRKRREKICLMALEGKRLICDAIDAGIDLKTIYFTKEENLVGIKDLSLLASKGLKLKKILYRDMKLFSDVSTCPGIMAICERPKNSKIFANPLYNEQKLPLILIGDDIRDPGNLGTMIRCAAAVGVEKFILTKGCVDVWDSKVLRSGAGAHFRLPIISDIEWPLIFNHIPVDEPFDLFIAESNQELDRNPLNRTIKKPFTETDIPLHTINTITKDIDPKTNEIILRDNSYEDIDNQLIKYRNSSIGLNTYSDAKFYALGIERKSVLVIGGETHGLSDQSYKLAYDYIGRRIKIPLAFGVDSLNSAVAAAVILYEMKRQFLSICSAADNQNIQQNI